jgi:hypothetical protein
MPYLTRHQLRNLRAAERRADAVQLMDDIRDTWPDPKTRPPGAAAAHDNAAESLSLCQRDGGRG